MLQIVLLCSAQEGGVPVQDPAPAQSGLAQQLPPARHVPSQQMPDPSVHGPMLPITTWVQTPPAQSSVVQALESSQSPAPQQSAHVPLQQRCPVPQGCPQPPQFRVSVRVFVQASLQQSGVGAAQPPAQGPHAQAALHVCDPPQPAAQPCVAPGVHAQAGFRQSVREQSLRQ